MKIHIQRRKMKRRLMEIEIVVISIDDENDKRCTQQINRK